MNEFATIVTPSNRQFKIYGPLDDKSVMAGMLASGRYEPHCQALMEYLIQPDWECLDIGANLGQHTVLMADLANKVTAIEASKENCPWITFNMLQNGLIHKSELNNVGVWNEEGSANFSYRADNNACSFFATTDYKQKGGNLQTVKLTTLDNLFPDKHFDFIKMDIEGSELRALEGASKFFNRHLPKLPAILLELNKFAAKAFMDIDIMTVVDKLYEIGYKKVSVALIYNGRTQWTEVDRRWLSRFFEKGVLTDALFTI